MIQWLRAEPDRLMITFNEREADRLKKDFEDVAGRIVSWQQYAQMNRQYKGVYEIGIDNADMILRNLTWHEIGVISISDEDDEEENTKA